MKKGLIILALSFSFSLLSFYSYSQCSICTKTAQQLGEKPAKGLNAGILYLAFIPFAIGGYLGYRWYRNNRAA
ncbi:MAG: hypothetical protein C4308_13100 [Chitinophagaceae bacterium]